ncbi:MAG: aliphatic sulfonate ABC transporter substrate-binding protein [Propionibacteriaceae bacterium]|nr:aliphatic sulfonate ABC transporter substrate-binding protein [Propionibacteriaceae bacterium]
MTARFNRRQILLGSAGLAGIATLAACGGDAKPADPVTPAAGETAAETPMTVDKINVGYIADSNGSMLMAVAEQEKLWEKHGLEVKTSTFTNGPLQIQALGTEDLDFGYIGFGALWLPMSGKASIVAIQSLGKADRVIAQPGITSMADLKGKKVGVPEGTSGDMILNLALEKAGMTVDDIERIPMDPPTLISAFSSGQIDGAGIWYPHVDTIVKQVPDLVTIAESNDFPDFAFPACQVANTNITDRPEILQKYQAVCKEAFTWAAENKEAIPALIADFLDAPEDAIASEQQYVEVLTSDDVIAASEDGRVEKWMTALNEQFVKAEKVDSVADVSTYWLGEEYKNA